MIKYLLFILFAFSTQAQNVWYIDRDATGSGNGTSWANAWTTFDGYWGGNPTGVNWNTVQSGDTVYVSGGTDSTVYRAPQWIRQANAINYNPRVSILPAWHEGHSGQVYFINEDTTQTDLFRIYNTSGLYIKGFIFLTNFPVPVIGSGGVRTVYVGDGSSNVHIDSCIISSKNAAGALALPGDFHTITNSTIETLHNNSVRDMDVFTLGYGKGGLTIRNNIIIQRNDAAVTDAHRDFIQASGTLLDDDTLRTTLFENNFMWVIRPNAGAWNQGIYVHSGELRARQRWVIRNNLMIIDVAPEYTGAFAIGSDDSTTMHSVHLYNNTFIVKGTPFTLRTIDTLIAKNNIFISTGDYYNGKRAIQFGRNDYHFPLIYKDINYNHYYHKNWNSDIVNFTNYNPHESGEYEYNWGEWQALGLDVNSDTGYVNLVDVRDSVISAYMTPESLRGQGADLSSLFTTDILGNERAGSWDIGALQYIEDGVADTIPSYSFTSVTDAELNSYHIASSVFTNADSIFHVWTETSDSFKVGALSDFDIIMVEAEAGDTVFISNVASGSYSTASTKTILAGGVERTFSVTTKAEPVSTYKRVVNPNGRRWVTPNGRAIIQRGGQ